MSTNPFQTTPQERAYWQGQNNPFNPPPGGNQAQPGGGGGGGGGQQGGGGGGGGFQFIGQSAPQLQSVGQMNPQLQQQLEALINRQLAENQSVAQENRQNWQGAVGGLRQVLPNMMADPMQQGARNLASQRLANPESISDQVQQRAINRASNLINAGAQAGLRGAMGGLAQGGQLGGSAQQLMGQRMEQNRANALATMTSDLERERALRRTEDMRSALSDAQGLSQQYSGMDFGINNSILQNLPQINPQDFGSLMAILTQMGMMGYGSQGGGGQPMGAALPGSLRNHLANQGRPGPMGGF